jgi:hypothetical protein
MEKYYTPEQLEKLKKRRETLGDETIRSAEAEWQVLFKKYETEMKKGIDPSAEPVQKLAKRSWELIAAFTGGDTGIEKSLGKIYNREGAPNVLAQHRIQLNPHVWEFMGRAMLAYRNVNPEK